MCILESVVKTCILTHHLPNLGHLVALQYIKQNSTTQPAIHPNINWNCLLGRLGGKAGFYFFIVIVLSSAPIQAYMMPNIWYNCMQQHTFHYYTYIIMVGHIMPSINQNLRNINLWLDEQQVYTTIFFGGHVITYAGAILSQFLHALSQCSSCYRKAKIIKIGKLIFNSNLVSIDKVKYQSIWNSMEILKQASLYGLLMEGRAFYFYSFKYICPVPREYKIGKVIP